MKRAICVTMAAALLLLSGCSLALADSPEPGAEVLVGAFVSREPLGLPGGQELEGSREAEGWRFGGEAGVMVCVLPEAENDSLRFTKSDDPRVEYGGVTVGGGMTYEAVLTLPEEAQGASLHFNPLYRRSDGTLYARAAVGVSVSGAANTGGWRASETALGTPEGLQEGDWTSAVSIRYVTVSPPEEYVLCRMDGENRMLRQEVYGPGTLPERLSLADCRWLLVECRRADGTVERTAYGPEDGVLSTHGPGEDGFLRRWETALEWKTAD